MVNEPSPPDHARTWTASGAGAGYHRGSALRAQFFGPATERMLDLAEIHGGSRVLGVGAGTGDQTLAAARRVGVAGSVLAIDISASMLEMTATSAREAGLSNVATRVMDAQRLDLTSGSFDAAISRFALMLIPDVHRALAEIRRALRPGGTFAALVFSTADTVPFLSIPHAAARRVGRLTSPPEPFGEFRLAASGVLGDGFSKAGFRDVAVHVVATRHRFPSLADAIRYAKETPLPLRELLVQLDASQQDEVWAQSERAFQQFVGPDGFDAPCELLIGAGTK
jgi:SAM-dependent methyltransferase